MPDDARTWAVARSLIDHALDWGWDDQHGGFYDKGDSFAAPAYDLTKVWWTEAEGLNALAVMNRKFGGVTDRYAKAFAKQWEFIQEHQIDHQHAGWFAETSRDGTLLGDGAKANQWKANYHTARALMNVARLLEAAGRRD
jgi:mannobiose 2-epimerase